MGETNHPTLLAQLNEMDRENAALRTYTAARQMNKEAR